MLKALPALLFFYMLLENSCKMDHPDRQAFIEALKAYDESFAGMLEEEMLEIELLETPFLDQFQVYYLYYFAPDHPRHFYLGFHRSEELIDLTGSEEQFKEMISRDEVDISAEEEAKAFVKLFFETTRDPAEFSYIVASPDEIRFRPNLKEDEQKRKEELLEELAGMDLRWSVRSDNGAYLVTYYVVQGQQLAKHQARLQRDGRLSVASRTVMSGLPTVYSL